MAPPGTRRDDRVDAVAVEQRADAVPVACEQTRQHGDELGRDRALLRLPGPEIHRRAQVQQEPRRDLAILVELPHVGRLETRRDVPVDVANVVVVLVLPQIGEIQAEAAEQRAVIPMHRSVEAADHRPLETAENALRIPRRLGHGLPAASRAPGCAA